MNQQISFPDVEKFFRSSSKTITSEENLGRPSERKRPCLQIENGMLVRKRPSNQDIDSNQLKPDYIEFMPEPKSRNHNHNSHEYIGYDSHLQENIYPVENYMHYQENMDSSPLMNENPFNQAPQPPSPSVFLQTKNNSLLRPPSQFLNQPPSQGMTSTLPQSQLQQSSMQEEAFIPSTHQPQTYQQTTSQQQQLPNTNNEDAHIPAPYPKYIQQDYQYPQFGPHMFERSVTFPPRPLLKAPCMTESFLHKPWFIHSM